LAEPFTLEELIDAFEKYDFIVNGRRDDLDCRTLKKDSSLRDKILSELVDELGKVSRIF
jgi:hypothetical protein